jgi:hypothetical protein
MNYAAKSSVANSDLLGRDKFNQSASWTDGRMVSVRDLSYSWIVASMVKRRQKFSHLIHGTGETLNPRPGPLNTTGGSTTASRAGSGGDTGLKGPLRPVWPA